MGFRGLMVLRDEGDIIQQTLDHLLTWVDGLYILDTGSTDNTWDIIQDYAGRDKRIVPLDNKPLIFNDNLRGYLFHKYRDRFHAGDWVLRLDGDEFYHVAPPKFVDERLRRYETAVYLQWYYFRITRDEVDDYESGRVDALKDRQRLISDRRRFYKMSEYAEPRMFQYRRSMQWSEGSSFPINAGYVARERIPICHYPHRDPLQMRRRFLLRAEMMKLKAHAGGHWKLEDWRQDVVDRTGTSESQAHGRGGIGNYKSIDSGELLHWDVGTPLREAPKYNHVRPWRRRIALRALYGGLVGLMDRRRASFSPSFTPEYLSPEANDLIGQKCNIAFETMTREST